MQEGLSRKGKKSGAIGYLPCYEIQTQALPPRIVSLPNTHECVGRGLQSEELTRGVDSSSHLAHTGESGSGIVFDNGRIVELQ